MDTIPIYYLMFSVHHRKICFIIFFQNDIHTVTKSYPLSYIMCCSEKNLFTQPRSVLFKPMYTPMEITDD